MKTITQNARSLSFFVAVNGDRLLVPITIVGALFLAGWILSMITTPPQVPLPRP